MSLFAPLRRTRHSGGPLPFYKRLRWLWRFRQWQKTAYAEVLPLNPSPDTVAIVLSYKRPQNIDIIVRLLLRTPSVAAIVVSNNNPAYRLADWMSVHDPRCSMIEQPIARPRHIRYGIAAREAVYQRFLAVDDDLFLRPSQLESLCAAVRADPSRPHGITGLQYDSWRGMVFHHVSGRTQAVDAINRVYAFTSAHVDNFRQLMRETGFDPRHTAWRHSYWDDLFLSYSAGKPMVHALGSFLDCPSQFASGIAVWKQPDFFRLRLSLLRRLRLLRPVQS